jgi:hypothetical protein
MTSAMQTMNQLLILSRTQPDGAVLSTWIQTKQGVLSLLEEGSQETPLTVEIIVGVFARYGKPLDAQISEWVGALSLREDLEIKSFRFMNWGDVYKTDYLGLFQAGQDALVAPSPLIAAALKALSLALLRRQ